MVTNYRGSIVTQIYKAIEANEELSVGEVLYSFLHKNFLNKHFFYATDQELYTALERFNSVNEEEIDEPLTENEFDFWLEQKFVVKK